MPKKAVAAASKGVPVSENIKTTATTKTTDTKSTGKVVKPEKPEKPENPKKATQVAKKPAPQTPSIPKEKPMKAAQADRITKALEMARNLRPDKSAELDQMEETYLPSKQRAAAAKRKFIDDMFSEEKIAQTIKKQRLNAAKQIERSNLKTTPGAKKTSKTSISSSFRQLSDSDSDDDNDFKKDSMHDLDDKDNYAADDDDFDGNTNSLVTLTSGLLSLHTVRTAEDEELDKITGKQAEDMYMRKKKVISTKDASGKIIKRDLSGNEIKGDDVSRLDRTIFLGNVPNTAKETDIKKFLGVPIETIRFRSAGFDTTHLARWVAFAQKRFHKNRDTLVVFVVLKSTDDIQTVLAKNQAILLDKHIRVDLGANDGKMEPKRSIFVGNLPYDITEELVYEIFQTCGEIDAIRCVRDAQTGIGKGFAFVSFMSSGSVPAGLKLNDATPENLKRKLRITKVSPHAFGNTEAFKIQQAKQKMVLAKSTPQNTRSAKMYSKILKEDGFELPQESNSKKRVKVQGAFQKVVGNSGVGATKKARHQPRSDQPAWMGTRAKVTDSIGRNKATKKAGGDKRPVKGKGRK
jgi:nucleolar protein 12